VSTERDIFAAPVALTITLAGLASSTSGAGRQSNAVDNSSSGYPQILIWWKITLGTSPMTGNITFFLIRRETTSGIADDGAGASDAGITLANAEPVASFPTPSSTTTGEVMQGSFLLSDPGPNWCLGVTQSTGVALDPTAGNHAVIFDGISPTFS
jgi:hypothetical protein